jgi:hypothetical protein
MQPDNPGATFVERLQGAVECEPVKEVIKRAMDNNAMVRCKRDAMDLLAALKRNEPLDQEKLTLVLRGYISAMDLLIVGLG